MDNLAVARLLSETADLLELGQDNPFKIRAYRNAAEVIAGLPSPVSGMTPQARRALPGIGKDLSARLDEILATGTTKALLELRARTPVSLLDLKRLPGVGPRTLLQLWNDLGIATAADLEAAIQTGRLRSIRGFGPRKEAALLKALASQRTVLARHLLPECVERARAIEAWLRDRLPEATVALAGDVRRGAETCTGVDLVAASAPGMRDALVEAFTNYTLVETSEADGSHAVTARLWGGMTARLHIAAPAAFGAALAVATGSDAHVSALAARATARGLTLTAVSLTRGARRIDTPDEAALYEALGLSWVPPESREDAHLVDAGVSLPVLITRADLRGDLHMHTTASDGTVDADAMAAAARDAGLEYIVITDHSSALPMVNGLDNARALEHAAAVRALDRRITGIRVLAGIECDILADGTMDLDDDVLRSLDFVAASLHSGLAQPRDVITPRVLRALANPWVDMLAHPTGRKLLRRDGADLDIEAVIAAAAETGVALEINAQAARLDLRPAHARLARERGVLLTIDSDAHSPRGLALTEWGVVVARRAGVTAADCLNARPFPAFHAALRRNRTR